MRYLYSLLIAIGLEAAHSLYTTYIERPPKERSFFYDDFMTNFRPMVNLLYNGSFSQPLSPAEREKIPPSLRIILDSAQSQGECLPHQGASPGTGILLVPSIFLADWLDLKISQFETITQGLYHAYQILFLASLVYLLFLLHQAFEIKVFWLMLPLLLMPSYILLVLRFESYLLPLGLSILTLVLSVKKRSYLYLFISTLFAVWAYFCKFRAAPFIFIPAIIWILSFGFNKGKPVFILLATWLIPQGLWSWHVYRHTCKLVLTDPSPIFSVTLCSENTLETCWSPKQVYNYVRVKLGDLEAILGMPHSIMYNPRSLMLCIGREIKKDSISAACLPKWVHSKVITREKWREILYNIKQYYHNDSLSEAEKVAVGKLIAKELDTIMVRLKSEYKWLPLYRGLMVLKDNIFHPPLTAEEGRGRVPRWVKQLYFNYISVYATLSLVLGLFSSLYFLIGIVRDIYPPFYRGVLLALIAATWGMIIVPVITGHSEWRYFFFSVLFGYPLSVIALHDLIRRKRKSKE